jgi:hypothetical protein
MLRRADGLSRQCNSAGFRAAIFGVLECAIMVGLSIIYRGARSVHFSSRTAAMQCGGTASLEFKLDPCDLHTTK